MEEINDMLDEAERDFKAGKGIPSEEVFREIEAYQTPVKETVIVDL